MPPICYYVLVLLILGWSKKLGCLLKQKYFCTVYDFEGKEDQKKLESKTKLGQLGVTRHFSSGKLFGKKKSIYFYVYIRGIGKYHSLLFGKRFIRLKIIIEKQPNIFT